MTGADDDGIKIPGHESRLAYTRPAGIDCTIVLVVYQLSKPVYPIVQITKNNLAGRYLPHRREDGVNSDKHATPA